MIQRIFCFYTLFFFFIISTSNGKEKVVNIKMNLPCLTCYQAVNKFVMKLDGVHEGKWNPESGIMKVWYDNRVIKKKEIINQLRKEGYLLKSLKEKKLSHYLVPACCTEKTPLWKKKIR